jgi:hypothetical protein
MLRKVMATARRQSKALAGCILTYLLTYSVALVRKRTVPTERAVLILSVDGSVKNKTVPPGVVICLFRRPFKILSLRMP